MACRARRHPPGLPAAVPPDPDDHDGGHARRPAADARQRRRVGAAQAARLRHGRRPAAQPGADALHHAGDLPVSGPAAAVAGAEPQPRSCRRWRRRWARRPKRTERPPRQPRRRGNVRPDDAIDALPACLRGWRPGAGDAARAPALDEPPRFPPRTSRAWPHRAAAGAVACGPGGLRLGTAPDGAAGLLAALRCARPRQPRARPAVRGARQRRAAGRALRRAAVLREAASTRRRAS